jgi:hypothetical protein
MCLDAVDESSGYYTFSWRSHAEVILARCHLEKSSAGESMLETSL